jgi:hypothetical protein
MNDPTGIGAMTLADRDIEAPLSPLLDLALAMAIRSPCVICEKEITLHDMRGDQVVAVCDGGGKQAHLYCWEKLTKVERNALN